MFLLAVMAFSYNDPCYLGNYKVECFQYIWHTNGCTTALIPGMQSRVDWWRTQTRATIYNDIRKWAKSTDYGQRKACYGDNRDNWPVDCNQYNGQSTNLSKNCLQ